MRSRIISFQESGVSVDVTVLDVSRVPCCGVRATECRSLVDLS